MVKRLHKTKKYRNKNAKSRKSRKNILSGGGIYTDANNLALWFKNNLDIENVNNTDLLQNVSDEDIIKHNELIRNFKRNTVKSFGDIPNQYIQNVKTNKIQLRIMRKKTFGEKSYYLVTDEKGEILNDDIMNKIKQDEPKFVASAAYLSAYN